MAQEGTAQHFLFLFCNPVKPFKYFCYIFNCFSVTIISREQWGALLPKNRDKLKGIVQRVVIHHTDTPTSTNPQEGIERVASIQRYHMSDSGRKFDDIGYK